MVCSTAPSSSHSLSADSVVYNYVKRKKPQLLLELFGKERCRELEGQDHLYDRSAFLSALKTVPLRSKRKERVSSEGEKKRVACDVPSVRTNLPRDDQPVLARPNGETTQNPKKKESAGSKTVQEQSASVIPKRPKVKITSELAVFNYFYERQQKEALQLLFDEEVRKDYGRKVETMGIWMPSVTRIYAWYRYVELKKVVRDTAEIWKCRLCTKQMRGKGCRSFLFSHIGIHENIPCPCVVDECNAILRNPSQLPGHLQKKHVLLINNLTAKQYHQMTTMRKDFYHKAKAFRDKYFPPESFIGFKDCKIGNVARDFEDPKCQECGAMITAVTTRRNHVAKHLNLSYNCVFDGCEFNVHPFSFPVHFTQKHATNVAQLGEERLFKYKRIKGGSNFVGFSDCESRETGK
ncbi:hypothetical protein QR680_008286 [Steinernema hermaphroditum]|uniref:Uncharacterized protein n=1 Tax=Steinernema hermaphroditum TaxID=289476 RepID=A0AA39IHK0_9BILA|nr:hypothetical protein QR680_008286 [Steinernema hermaphroditum]